MAEVSKEELLGAFERAVRNVSQGIQRATMRDEVPLEIADLERARAAVLARMAGPGEVVVQGWQPIETARKDGRTLLLGYHNSHGKWRTLRGQWFTQRQIDEEWEDDSGATEGWYETSVEADDTPNCWSTNPTHWMPVPSFAARPNNGGTDDQGK